MLRSRSWSRGVAVVLGVLLAGGAAGCGSGSGSGEDAADAGRKLESPVTVEHRFGSTTIDTVPERIVTIDLQWTDTMLAMGVEPVGHTVDDLMPESGVPWQELPQGSKALSLTDGVPVEEILALEPDLVVGSFSIDNKETYQQLSGSVPTIAGLGAADEVTPWQDLVRTAGKILGKPDDAERVIASVDDDVASTASNLPGLEGKTFALAQYIVGDSMYIVADEEDGSSVLFRELGMRMYPPVREEGVKTGSTRLNVSTERADLLRSDLLAFLVNGGDESDLADIPGFDQLPGTVAVLDYPAVVGLNTPSPLSLPYSLGELEPYLQKVAGKAGT